MVSNFLRRTRRGDLVLPGSLRGVERLVGGAEEVLRVGRFVVREARDAEGCGDGLAMRERARGDDLPDPVRVEPGAGLRSEEHTSELQSRPHLVCRLLLEKKKQVEETDSHVST